MDQFDEQGEQEEQERRAEFEGEAIHSSMNEVRMFLETPTWKDITNIISEIVGDTRSSLECINPRENPDAIIEAQNKLAFAEMVLSLPANILNDLASREESLETENAY